MKWFWLSWGILGVVSSFIIPVILVLIGFITLNNIGFLFIISIGSLISGFLSIKHGFDMY